MTWGLAEGGRVRPKRRGAALVALALWAISLGLPALGGSDGSTVWYAGWTAPPGELQTWWSGAEVLDIGWVALAPSPSFLFGLAWLSNLVGIYVSGRLILGRPGHPVLEALGLSAAFFSLGSMRSLSIWRGSFPDESSYYKVMAFGAGYWLWLASLGLLLVLVAADAAPGLWPGKRGTSPNLRPSPWRRGPR